MREILFRAKPYRDKWLYGYYAKKCDWADIEAHYIITVNDTVPWKHDFFEEHIVDPDTVCQSTGKLDKNGRKIFEGDIVRAMMDYDPGGYFESIVPIKFREAEGGYEWQYYDMNTIEVVGNIYDNPDILKGE